MFVIYILKKAQAPIELPKATNSVGKPEIAASPPVSFSIATRPLSLQSQIQSKEKERERSLSFKENREMDYSVVM